MMSITAPFTYPRRLRGREIRLADVSQMSDGSLHISMTHHHLDECPSFISLSYVWGPYDKSCAVHCEDQQMRISKNLHSILFSLRRYMSSFLDTPLLWIDAICINQKDDVEKSEQVRLMKEIYERAYRVVGWLGEQSEVKDCAFTMLGLLWAFIYEGPKAGSANDDGDADRRKQLTDPMLDDLVPLGLPAIEDPRWKSIYNVLQHPWFTRVWIIQEFVSAKKFVFLCGNRSVDGIKVFQSFKIIAESQYMTAWLMDGLKLRKHLHSILTLDLIKERNSVSKLFGRLMVSYSYDSTDPRDKVFALVQLGKGGDQDLIDYSLSLASVMIETSSRILGSSPLSLLACCWVFERDPNCKLPSWVAPFHSQRVLGYPARVQDLEAEEFTLKYPCIARGSPGFKDTFWIDEKPNEHYHVLKLSGKIEDHISEICETTMPNLLSNFDAMGVAFDRLHSGRGTLEYIETLQQSQTKSIIFSLARHREFRLVKSLPCYPTGQPISEVYWRSLIRDNDGIEPLEIPETVSRHLATLQWYEKGESIAKSALEFLTLDEERRSVKDTFIAANWQQFYRLLAHGYLTYVLISCWWSHGISNAVFSALWRYIAYLCGLFIINLLATFSVGIAKSLAMRAVDRKQKAMVDCFGVGMRHLHYKATVNLGRRLCLTKDGYVVWAPAAVRSGDVIFRLFGSDLLLAVRKEASESAFQSRFTLIGDVYMHGLMNKGKAERATMDKIGLQCIELV